MAAPKVDRSPEGDGVVLAVHVVPGAGRAGIGGVHGDALKVRVTAPARGGLANTAVEELLAELFAVRPRAVRVVAGTRSRAKRVRISGVDPTSARARLRDLLENP